MNPYETLGINKEASQDEIKKAYRDLSKKHHPDKKDGDEDKFKEISQAYEILKDPKKKSQFDHFGSVDDAFSFAINNFFSRGRQARRRVDSDVRSAMRISLSDSIFGCEKVIKIKRIIACESCKSTGQEETIKRTCSDCGGRGHISMQRGNSQFVINCSSCNGQGVSCPKCEKCNGSGFFNKSEKVSVKIPKNLNSNSIIRIAGKGNITYWQDELQIGSHYLVVDFPSAQDGVMRHGKDLHTNTQVPIDRILAEDEVTLRIFDKEELKIKLKANQDLFSPYEINTDFLNQGKLFVKVLPKMPTNNISDDKREKLVKALREAYGESERTLQPTNNNYRA
jgi:molecular chaperone DnaJ